MSIVINGNKEIAEFTATAPTQIQNREMAEVEYQTDNTADVWPVMDIGDGIRIDEGMTFYFRSQAQGRLSTLEIVTA